MMVHYFGQPQQIELFKSFCIDHNLFLIEDNAHGFGGKYNGKDLGTFGDIGISFQENFLIYLVEEFYISIILIFLL